MNSPLTVQTASTALLPVVSSSRQTEGSPSFIDPERTALLASAYQELAAAARRIELIEARVKRLASLPVDPPLS